ncbi:uncharacterized protein MONBRDRAFT_39031 [Monosiga brevicollis MX1]|uniref:Uncharacterized protein n=1 Tax=Monosiga brevicollis TaxID=81824 RepID=A9VBT1_MONBE|nr:uncharacterized protein MONBRDRAFT_39031 [Monosiga brevicollis MX1]EDQ84986.1 predicted protein [Monosiga brevicollis MX1]|eukprot:XP_001750156.1 hypothetical protein [Monosiga brevicollis MX1]
MTGLATPRCSIPEQSHEPHIIFCIKERAVYPLIDRLSTYRATVHLVRCPDWQLIHRLEETLRTLPRLVPRIIIIILLPLTAELATGIKLMLLGQQGTMEIINNIDALAKLKSAIDTAKALWTQDIDTLPVVALASYRVFQASSPEELERIVVRRIDAGQRLAVRAQISPQVLHSGTGLVRCLFVRGQFGAAYRVTAPTSRAPDLDVALVPIESALRCHSLFGGTQPPSVLCQRLNAMDLASPVLQWCSRLDLGFVAIEYIQQGDQLIVCAVDVEKAGMIPEALGEDIASHVWELLLTRDPFDDEEG